MVVMSAKLANGLPLGVAKGWNISWKFPEYLKNVVIFWDFLGLFFYILHKFPEIHWEISAPLQPHLPL